MSALDPRLERWLARLVATPGLTSLSKLEEARRLHVDDALAARDLIEEGPVADVGSGGGSPGLPLAAALPHLAFVLVESSRRKCAFLRETARDFPNVSVVCARAEDHGRGAGREAYAVVLARALAPPAVAVEWCLPLVRASGVLVLYAGAADETAAASAARIVGGAAPRVVLVAGWERKRLLVFRKLEPTPERFPRRPGAARKRPLA